MDLGAVAMSRTEPDFAVLRKSRTRPLRLRGNPELILHPGASPRFKDGDDVRVTDNRQFLRRFRKLLLFGSTKDGIAGLIQAFQYDAARLGFFY